MHRQRKQTTRNYPEANNELNQLPSGSENIFITIFFGLMNDSEGKRAERGEREENSEVYIAEDC